MVKLYGELILQPLHCFLLAHAHSFFFRNCPTHSTLSQHANEMYILFSELPIFSNHSTRRYKKLICLLFIIDILFFLFVYPWALRDHLTPIYSNANFPWTHEDYWCVRSKVKPSTDLKQWNVMYFLFFYMICAENVNTTQAQFMRCHTW